MTARYALKNMTYIFIIISPTLKWNFHYHVLTDGF
jgi:hypothetical protein